VPSALGPFGAKGVGEPPVVPVAAAIANAIRDAVGVRMTQIPMMPERVFASLSGRAMRGESHGSLKDEMRGTIKQSLNSNV
jgi:hypothetical protein